MLEQFQHSQAPKAAETSFQATRIAIGRFRQLEIIEKVLAKSETGKLLTVMFMEAILKEKNNWLWNRQIGIRLYSVLLLHTGNNLNIKRH